MALAVCKSSAWRMAQVLLLKKKTNTLQLGGAAQLIFNKAAPRAHLMNVGSCALDWQSRAPLPLTQQGPVHREASCSC